MKKGHKIWLLLVIILITILSIARTSVSATTIDDVDNDVKFENFEFSVSKKRVKGELKVILHLYWETDQKIIVNKISAKIPGKDQVTLTTESNDEGTYNFDYQLENWQVGMLELIIDYQIEEEIGLDTSHQKVLYIPAGKWLKEEVGWGISVVLGLLTTICVVIGTFVIIENSKKGYVGKDNE